MAEKPAAAVAQARNELENAGELGNAEAVKAARKRLAAAGVDDTDDDAKRKAPEGRTTRARSTTAKDDGE